MDWVPTIGALIVCVIMACCCVVAWASAYQSGKQSLRLPNGILDRAVLKPLTPPARPKQFATHLHVKNGKTLELNWRNCECLALVVSLVCCGGVSPLIGSRIEFGIANHA
eukprot:4001054-Amphidinium_carterae.1